MKTIQATEGGVCWPTNNQNIQPAERPMSPDFEAETLRTSLRLGNLLLAYHYGII